MQRLKNKRIVLGITGGIAAYKSAELVRKLCGLGAVVQVVMSRAAQEFITPLTLQALSGNAVHTDLLDPNAEAGMGHIELARWADLILIAPATANILAKMAQGIADDLLTTLLLATRAKIAVAPAMNQQMWLDEITQENVSKLHQRGVLFFGPDSGSQACGDIGPGRMLEPVVLAQCLADCFKSKALTGKRVVITAGPTQEKIDPVRYISNYSSGKMGFAIAQAAAEMDADVHLVSGPVHLETPERVKRIQVISADDMLQAVEQAMPCDIFISVAAVADFKMKHIASQKLKKHSSNQEGIYLELIRNPDILATIAKREDRPFCVGFAAETEHVLEYAAKKLQEKNLDLIVANDVSEEMIGFGSDDNAITVVDRHLTQSVFERANKSVIAHNLLNYIVEKLDKVE